MEFYEKKFQDDSVKSPKKGKPIYVHVPKDLPLHLHFDRDLDDSRITDTNNSAKMFSGNVPWVPPPGRTTRKLVSIFEIHFL